MSVTKVQGGFIDTNAVNSANIADGSVTTSKLPDGAVTTAKLSTGAPSWDTSGNLSATSFVKNGGNSSAHY